jgi:poly-gamma-glutamate synthase PgsB/CapB
VASILREHGSKVLAKTTGSEANYILPDGQEAKVTRNGLPSIMEQKDLIKEAANLRVDCLITEVMSIRPENHRVESRQILKPHIVLITNIRRDHTDAMGDEEKDIAAVLANDITPGAKVFVPQAEEVSIFKGVVKKMGGELILVETNSFSQQWGRLPTLKKREFLENINLAYSLGKYLKIDKNTILEGLKKTNPDIGAIKVWKYQQKQSHRVNWFVNGFAANDPESTRKVISKIKEIVPLAHGKLVGLLTLRSDRGDRTIQWIEALSEGGFDFQKIFVTGIHANIVKSRLGRIKILKKKSPQDMTADVIKEVEDQDVIMGFGNLQGTGRALVDYWDKVGETRGL